MNRQIVIMPGEEVFIKVKISTVFVDKKGITKYYVYPVGHPDSTIYPEWKMTELEIYEDRKGKTNE